MGRNMEWKICRSRPTWSYSGSTQTAYRSRPTWSYSGPTQTACRSRPTGSYKGTTQTACSKSGPTGTCKWTAPKSCRSRSSWDCKWTTYTSDVERGGLCCCKIWSDRLGVGQVLAYDQEDGEYSIKFMESSGRNTSTYKWPKRDDIWMHQRNIIIPTAKSGRVFKLSDTNAEVVQQYEEWCTELTMIQKSLNGYNKIQNLD